MTRFECRLWQRAEQLSAYCAHSYWGRCGTLMALFSLKNSVWGRDKMLPRGHTARVQGLGFEYRPVTRARGLTFALCCFQHSGMLQVCGMSLIFITVCQILSSWLLSHASDWNQHSPGNTTTLLDGALETRESSVYSC